MIPPPNVVFTIPKWEISGVTSVTLDLATALRDLGAKCQLVLEEDNRADCPYDLPAEIPCRALLGGFQWWRFVPSNSLKYRWRLKVAQGRLRKILYDAKPACLIPGYAHGLCAPAGSWGGGVGVFGVVHSVDDANVLFAAEHGGQWASCICVSDLIASRVQAAAPWMEPRLRVIPNGVPCSITVPMKNRKPGDPVRVVYAGRFEQVAKRIRDLPDLVDLAATRKIPVQWDLAGEGPEEPFLRERLRPHIDSGTVAWHGSLKRTAVRELFRRADAVILLSNYEGSPMSLIEGMAEGCVPLVTTGSNAGADLVRASRSGFVLPTGDLGQFADALLTLASAGGPLEELRQRAWSAISQGRHNSATMGAAYSAVIREWIEAGRDTGGGMSHHLGKRADGTAASPAR